MNFSKIIEDTNNAAVVIREQLEPAEGFPSIIYPPSFARPKEESGGSQHLMFPYRSESGDMRTACYLDTVASQFNRIENSFAYDPYRHLVADVRVKWEEQETPLVHIGHRIADAAVRFARGEVDLSKLITDYDRGYIHGLASFSAMSCLGGYWDSRGSGIRAPRLVQSSVVAYDVTEARHGFSYKPAFSYEGLGLSGTKTQNNESKSAEGFGHHSSRANLGGVHVGEHTKIVRMTTFNLSVLRAWNENPVNTKAVEYLYALGLVALSMPIRQAYRQGCLLVRREGTELRSEVRCYTGGSVPMSIDHDDAKKYAAKMAKSVGITGETIMMTFDPELAKEALQGKKVKSDAKNGNSKTKANGKGKKAK